MSETITVTGASPVVDTQSMRQQETLNTSDLEALPSGNIGLQTLAYVTPGFAATQADVGGTRDTWSAQGNYTFYHGKTGTRASFDGFRNQYFIGAASGVGYITDQGNIQELQLETSGMGAESGSGSTSLNAIPKSGSNTFAGGLDGYFSNGAMQGANISDNLNDWAQGNPALLATARHQDRGVGAADLPRWAAQFGGPIKQDKIWFFTAIARWGSTVQAAERLLQPAAGHRRTFPAKASSVRRRRCSIRASRARRSRTRSRRTPAGRPRLRLVPQPRGPHHRTRSTPKNRFNVYARPPEVLPLHDGPFTGANSIESERGWDWYPSGVVQGTWTAPITSRLLLEAGASWQTANWVNFAEKGVTQRRPLDSRNRDELSLRRDHAPDRAESAHGPQRRALLGVVRDRHPQHEGRRHRRAGVQRRVAQPQQQSSTA